MAGRFYVFYYPGLSEDTCIEAIGDMLLSLLSDTPFITIFLLYFIARCKEKRQ